MKKVLLGLALCWSPFAQAQVIVDGSGGALPHGLKETVIRKVADKFKDPVGTQFRRMAMVPSKTATSDVVCGQVNSKNSYGAFIGFQFFTYIRLESNDVVSVMPLDQLEKAASKPELSEPYRKVGCIP